MIQKTRRHELIRQMIKEEKLNKQKQIQARLEKEGIYVTQTTLSRDLRDLGLTKIKKDGVVYYVLAQDTMKIDIADYLSRHVQSVSRAEFTLVFKTRLGEAAIIANVLDTDTDERLLGTVAGADTLLVICRDQDAARSIELAVKAHLVD